MVKNHHQAVGWRKTRAHIVRAKGKLEEGQHNERGASYMLEWGKGDVSVTSELFHCHVYYPESDNNRDDSASDSVPVKATIEFRGVQITYTFPVGVTMLWWFAPANVNAVRRNGTRARALKDSGHEILPRFARNI
ncbi:hypothetical protein C8J56DRAFT_889467 [Mycena floridula]|nr:hypothetical protein C8J56DRAFT_889467 [Mycena floridula]